MHIESFVSRIYKYNIIIIVVGGKIESPNVFPNNLLSHYKIQRIARGQDGFELILILCMLYIYFNAGTRKSKVCEHSQLGFINYRTPI